MSNIVVRFINTTSEKIDQLPISEGALIVLTDKPGAFYDIGGIRRSVSDISEVLLKSQGTENAGKTFVVNSEGNVELGIIQSLKVTYDETTQRVKFSTIDSTGAALIDANEVEY